MLHDGRETVSERPTRDKAPYPSQSRLLTNDGSAGNRSAQACQWFSTGPDTDLLGPLAAQAGKCAALDVER